MEDFPNKIVTIILIFVMLVVAPITWMYTRDAMVTERIVLNELSQFLDKTTDKASITHQDIDDLYIGVNASGGTYDVNIDRYTPTPIPNGENASRLLYSNIDYLDEDGEPIDLVQGDIIKVTALEVGVSPTKRLLWTVLRMDSGSGDLTLSATIR